MGRHNQIETRPNFQPLRGSPAGQRLANDKREPNANISCTNTTEKHEKWLGFLDAYRTLCLDPPQEIRLIFAELRRPELLEYARP